MSNPLYPALQALRSCRPDSADEQYRQFAHNSAVLNAQWDPHEREELRDHLDDIQLRDVCEELRRAITAGEYKPNRTIAAILAATPPPEDDDERDQPDDGEPEENIGGN